MAESRLDSYKTIPYFHLRGKGSLDFDSSSLKRNKNLLLFFMTSISADYLFKLEEVGSDIKAQDTEIAVVCPVPLKEIEELHAKYRLTFSLLSDQSREVFSKFIKAGGSESVAALFIADKSGLLFFQHITSSPEDLPPFEDIVKSLIFVESQHK